MKLAWTTSETLPQNSGSRFSCSLAPTARLASFSPEHPCLTGRHTLGSTPLLFVNLVTRT